MHRRYAEHRIHGEWFAPVGAILAEAARALRWPLPKEEPPAPPPPARRRGCPPREARWIPKVPPVDRSNVAQVLANKMIYDIFHGASKKV